MGVGRSNLRRQPFRDQPELVGVGQLYSVVFGLADEPVVFSVFASERFMFDQQREALNEGQALVGTDLFEIVFSAGFGTLTHAVKGNVGGDADQVD